MNMRLLCLFALLSTLVACGGGGGGGSATGTVSGKVLAASDGSAIAGAVVRSGTASATSDASGNYSLRISSNDRVVVQAAASGYAEALRVASVQTGRTTSLPLRLLPVGVTSTIGVAAGASVTVPSSAAQVTIPPAALVPTSGTAAATVSVSVTPINPAADATLMPGGFTTIAASGSPTAIESFGALAIDIRDAAGIRYNLATGTTATIRIPLATRSSNPPATIPLFFLNETTGRWVEEGTATLAGTAPNQYYEGSVSHFSYWNADRVSETIFVSGCVRDANNQPVANLTIFSDGVDYSGLDVVTTAADGSFRVGARKDSTTAIKAAQFSAADGDYVPITNVVNAGPAAADFTLGSCLVLVSAPFRIDTVALPPGIVGQTYSATLAASNGTPPLTWSVAAGTLPSGLSLNATSGVISGTPSTLQTVTFTIQAQDSRSTPQTAQRQFTVVIANTTGGGGGGTLTVTGGPTDLGGSFSPSAGFVTQVAGGAAIAWTESGTFEGVVLNIFDSVPPSSSYAKANVSLDHSWVCTPCTGITVNRTAGTATFANVVFGPVHNTAGSVTLNGTLNFTPF